MSGRLTEWQHNCSSSRSGVEDQGPGHVECREGLDPGLCRRGGAFPSSAMVRALAPAMAPDERNEAVREVLTHCNMCGRLGQTGAQPRGTRSLHEVLEAETKRIAHSLHDEAGQLLTVVHLKLADISREIPDECQPCLEEVCELLNRVEMQLRQLSHELHPTVLEHEGLVPAVKRLIEGVSGRTGLQITLGASVQVRLSAAVETAIYRAVQEALTNVSRHAVATQVAVALHLDGGFVRCAIRDNGIGFDCDTVADGGLGLTGIRDRVEALGGRLAIDSRPGCGTEVSVRIPCS